MVVTASKVEQQLINAPATVSLISAQTLASKPASAYASLFRSVPGMNVTPTSARDVNITSRGATGTLSTSQLALVNASVGIKLARNKALAQIKVNNFLNQEVQQHNFGDVIKRSVVGDLRVTF